MKPKDKKNCHICGKPLDKKGDPFCSAFHGGEDVKERPIIFDSESVRAVLDGRKTQTRRVIKSIKYQNDYSYRGWRYKDMIIDNPLGLCPYGKPGDRLWVRETFVIETNLGTNSNESYPPPFNDGHPINWVNDSKVGYYWEQCHYKSTDITPELGYKDYTEPCCLWKPPLHMPRWASRITLEIINVRVERLQEISNEDARNEGVLCFSDTTVSPNGKGFLRIRESYKKQFRINWNSLNAKRGYPWKSNPWVWVIEFKRI